MTNKVVSLSMLLIGIIGLFIFKDVLFMQIISTILVVVPILLMVVLYDKEWGNPFEWLRNIRIEKQRNTNLIVRGGNKERAFVRVQNTIKNGKIFVSQEEDGIYIRLAGNENEGEAFAEKKVKVYDYEK